MKIHWTLMALLVLLCFGCQKTVADTKTETTAKTAKLIAALDANFTQEQMDQTFKVNGGFFGLFLKDAPQKQTGSSLIGITAKLIHVPTKGFKLELATSQFGVLEKVIRVQPDGIVVHYWSQDFLSNDERYKPEVIEKESVYRLYEGFILKADFLKAAAEGLNWSLDPYKVGFFVMKITKEQKTKPELGQLR